jgi:alkylation response protein AidB-like acyl-CoA dehydrogenase
MALDFALPESAQLLQRSARQYLERTYSLERARQAEASESGLDASLWGDLTAMGWLGLASAGPAHFLDACALLEELGRARAIVPVKEAVIGVGYAAWAQGDQSLGQAVAAGHIYTCAAVGQWEGLLAGQLLSPLRAEEEGSSLRVWGTLPFLPFASAAEAVLAVAQGPFAEGLALLLLPMAGPGVQRRRLRTVSPVPQFEVVLSGVSSDGRGVLAQGQEALQRWRQFLAVATCAEALGACSQVLEMSLQYAKERVQFGQPIGSFQAIQNRFADMVIDLDITRFLVYDAAWRLAAGEEAGQQLAYLGAWAGPALERICVQGHHINGAMSVTEEYGLEFYSRLALGARLALGEPEAAKEGLLAAIQARLLEV